MNQDNFYDVLGVSETATQDDIKNAYRKLAKENHPDKGGDEELFKKISAAHDVIGNEEKRSEYDNSRRRSFGFGDVFQRMYNQSFGHKQRNRVHDTVIDTNITVIESYLASEKEITYQRKTKCEPCNGNGGEKQSCNGCNGQGFHVRQMGSGMFVQMVRVACERCNGVGQMNINPCYSCQGSGTKDEIKKVNIKLPHGIDEGQFVRLQGVGDFKNGIYGNLVIKINLNPENNFEKYESHLVYNAYFNLEDLQKDSFTVPHPDGELIIKFPKLFDTTKPLRLKSKGFKNDGNGDLLINQYVRFERD